jgi:hypothetical protein
MDRNDVAVARGERAPVNNNAQGWGVAAFIVALAIACTLGAWTLHKQTYRSPNDPAAAVGGGQASGH